MKATLATLACLLTVGFLSAAFVNGNNTAVVIRKNPVEAKNGYQFLCIPVDGLNIAGGKGGEIALETVLPAATLPNGTDVMGVLEDGTPFNYRVTNGIWKTESGQDLTEPVTFPGGQIFWLNTKGSRTRSSSSASNPIVFCGQDRARTVITPVGGAATPMSNDSSVAVKLKDVLTSPKQLDQILTIKAGSSDYTIYRYLGTKWYGPGSENDCSEVEIAPGEAFYYYTKSATPAN